MKTTETDALTPEGFCEFVAQQDAVQEIHHDGGWECCAIGEYAEYITGQKTHYSDAGKFSLEIKETHPQTYEKMNVGNTHPEIATYGGLHNQLLAEGKTS